METLGEELRRQSWTLALEVAQEGFDDDVIPSLARLGPAAQLGDMPTFIGELGRELAQPDGGRLRVGAPLAAQAREHARTRERLGFAPREIVTEFLLLRRVVWRFLADRVDGLGHRELIELERRLNDTIDRLVVECVAAYFDRATAELAEQARRDPLTGLLNHQAFTATLEQELERARRYGHGLTLVFADLDDFKSINDTLGHVDGDRVLNRVGAAATSILRGSDVAGRLGGDEFAVRLLEADRQAGHRFVQRLRADLGRLAEDGELPCRVEFSAGSANYPADAADAEQLVRLADARQYAVKRRRRQAIESR